MAVHDLVHDAEMLWSKGRRESALLLALSAVAAAARYRFPDRRTISDAAACGEVRQLTERQLRQIFDRTHGHCHFCGDPVVFQKRGWAETLNGHWEVDHVIQCGKGGLADLANCLPACTRCNRLRWHRTGEAVRELLLLGLVAADEVKRQSPIERR